MKAITAKLRLYWPSDQRPANRLAGVHRPGGLYERALPDLQSQHAAWAYRAACCLDQRQHYPQYVVGPGYRRQNGTHTKTVPLASGTVDRRMKSCVWG